MIDLMVISHASFMSINRRIYQLIKKNGYTVELIVPNKLKFPTGIKIAEAKQLEDPEIHFLDLEGTNPRTYTYKKIIQTLSKRKPKAILLDNDPISFLAGTLGVWAKKNNAKLFCISCENLSLSIADNFSRRGIKILPNIITKRLLINRNKNNVDGVFCINKDGVEIFKKEGFKNVHWMPLGFDASIFYPNESSRKKIRQGLNINSKVIAYFGRIIPEKGVHLLIKALEQLKEHDWVLLMDSFEDYETEYIHEIKNLINSCGLEDRILFFKANHYEIADYMNASDLVIVPSITTKVWKEQYGRVAAEAMACGKLVIASKSGALPDLLNNNGILFEEGNIEDLKNVIKTILENNNSSIKSNQEISKYANETLSISNQCSIIQKLIFKN